MLLKKVISLAISEEDLEKIDKTSKALGISRSEFIEFLIKRGFDFPEDFTTSVSKISKLQKEAKENVMKGRRGVAE